MSSLEILLPPPEEVPSVPAPLKEKPLTGVLRWSRKMALDYALYNIQDRSDLSELLRPYNIAEEYFNEYIITDPGFIRAVDDLTDLINSTPITVSDQAQIMCESWLTELNRVMLSPVTDASVKAKLFTAVADIAGFKKAEEPDNRTININLTF